MARPQKSGLDYFPFDVSFFGDIKIRKLTKYQGIQAVPVYEILLCRIYERGYYLEWDEDIPFTVSEITHLDEDYIIQTVEYMVKVGLFDTTIYHEHNVLTSRSIQERYMSACSLTHRKIPQEPPYLLVDITPNKVNSQKTDDNSEQTLVFSEETTINSEEMAVNSEESTQIKEKKRKGKHSPSAETRTHEDETQGSWSGSDLVVYASVDEELEQLRASPIWKKQVFMRFKFLNCDDAALDDYLDRWGLEVKGSGKKHAHLGDAKSHFMNWMIIQEGKQLKTTSYGSNNGNGYRSREDIDAGTLRTFGRMSAAALEPKKELPVV